MNSMYYGYVPPAPRKRIKIDRVIDALCYWTGLLTISIVLAGLILFGFIKLQQHIESPSLSSGIVTAHSYHDGHTTYSAWTFGDYSLVRSHKYDGESFHIEVTNGEHTDWWEVTEEQYMQLKEGDYVHK